MVTATAAPFALPPAFADDTALAWSIVFIAEGIVHLAEACPSDARFERAIEAWWMAVEDAAGLIADLARMAAWPDGVAAADALRAHLRRDGEAGVGAGAESWWILLSSLAAAVAVAARDAWPDVDTGDDP